MADVTITIHTDEWYPVHTARSLDHPTAHFGSRVTVSEEKLAWWQRAADDFREAQADMEEALKEAGQRYNAGTP